ncbi:Peptidase M50B-like [Amycolatopsis pretoriensis]|uniref:Peptidase M50B-like n=1 Tax=Amycolatopsis pretoriensis TaxID=218821 RepID=A0A1H5QDE4_9PSEU|nr:M50 family metallopeptidase [Amycolatopsis pretoriensis]SEF24086.1 Peptidase M50B-like [Amycolatopsis pretoriensis]
MKRAKLDEIVNATAPAPGWWLVAVTGLAAVVVALASVSALLTGQGRLLTRFNVLGTFVHEGGHALMSVLTGGGVYRLGISSPESGVTWTWYPSRLSSILTSAAGYAMPSLAGLGAAVQLQRGHVAAVLTLTVVAAGLLLFLSADLLTFAIVAGIGLVAFAALAWAPPWTRTTIAYLETWLLLTSELSGVAHLFAARWNGEVSAIDDAASLAAKTHVPGFVWIAGWLALIVWALVKAFPLLWP